VTQVTTAGSDTHMYDSGRNGKPGTIRFVRRISNDKRVCIH